MRGKRGRCKHTFGPEAFGIAALVLGAGCTGAIDERQGVLAPVGTQADPAAGSAGAPGPAQGGGPEQVGAGAQPQRPQSECTPRGRPPLRRLNRDEYTSSLQELLGIASRPGDALPVDASRSPEGFDNNGDYLSISTELTSRLFEASEAAIAEGLSVSREPLLACSFGTQSPASPACAAEIVERFGSRAFRRPMTADEVAAHAKIVTDAHASGLDVDTSVGLGLQSILMSPHFLFEIVDAPSPHDPAAAYALSDHELATRLARFLRRGLPDEELRAAADAGQLRDPQVMRAQVARLLREDGAVFAESFSSQWLRTHEVLTKSVPPTVFAEFDDGLRQAMKRETDALYEHVVAEDLHPLAALTADYSFVDARLAEHYGMPGVTGGAQRVSMAGTHRVGVLSHASVMTSTSHSARTSPIARGHFVLSRILCSAPPPPPPDIPTLGEQRDELGEALTTREILEQHRRDPACAACHAQMDPIGLAFEVFDGIGRYRTVDEDGNAIDSAGELPGAGGFRDHEELVALLATSKRREVLRCMTGMMMAFAIGRTMQREDRCAIEAIADGLSDDDGIAELVTRIALSEPFRMQYGADHEGGP